MARYLELAEEAMREIRARRKLGRIAELPWPGYNGGKQFCCKLCDAHFDTSTGYAKHQVYGCYTAAPEVKEVHRDLPSCPKCGSFALYREKSGEVTCQTCEGRIAN
jgi:hypothetical protein